MRSGDRPWRCLPPELFAFTSGNLRELHTAVLSVFQDAAVLQPALRFDHVRSALESAGWDEPVTDDQLRFSLDQLVGWHLLDVMQDHAAHYATPEEFERRNLQWSLTPQGEAAIGGVQWALAELGRAVSLQPAVLDAIADGLGDLHRLISDDARAIDAGRVATTLAAVEGHLESMIASLRQFNRHLQRLVRDDAADDEVFLEVKRQTVAYLQEYITGVDRPTRRVAAAIARLRDGAGIAVLHDTALRGANLAPLGQEDPAPGWLAERARRWDALVVWFAPADGSDPRISTLLDVARQAILQLLRVLERRWEARRRSASVADDFRRLAGWFRHAASEDEAHVLFNVAFGAWPARHAHLLHPDAEAVPSTASWLGAAPVEVAPSLRASGTIQNRGRVRPVADPRAVRARRQRAQAEELLRDRELRRALATSGRVPLSSFAHLDAASFRELLGLIGEALSAPVGGDGRRRALSADGQIEIVLIPPRSARTFAVIVTDAGRLTSPDFGVSIVFTSGECATPMPSVAEAGGA
ncbi:MAG: TIGR02677 family protein [Actinobacteria bacterium]|nr:TIGR02677 family protein [Actinomycetota bacterium]